MSSQSIVGACIITRILVQDSLNMSEDNVNVANFSGLHLFSRYMYGGMRRARPCAKVSASAAVQSRFMKPELRLSAHPIKKS